MRRFVFAALFAFSCTCAFAVNMDDTVYKEIRVNGETITRPMTIREFSEYDSLGNLTYYNNGLDTSWYEYDGAGREIHSKEYKDFLLSPLAVEWWHEYDKKGRKIHSKSSEGNEKRFEYDGKGRLIRSIGKRLLKGPLPCEYDSEHLPINEDCYMKTKNAVQYDTSLYEYNGKGLLIHSKEKEQRKVDEKWYEYDDKGRKIYFKDETAIWRISREKRYQYDGKGNMIRVQIHDVGRARRGTHLSDTYEWRHEYDAKGRKIHSKSSEGYEEWFDNGLEIHSKNSKGEETWIEYDDRGNEICRRYSDGTIYWTEYTFWKNGKVKTKTKYGDTYAPPDYAQP